jgi:broad specificity phosphatase PhoE
MLFRQQGRESVVVRTVLLCCAWLSGVGQEASAASADSRAHQAGQSCSGPHALAFVHRMPLGSGGSKGDNSFFRTLKRRREKNGISERTQSETRRLYDMVVSKDHFERKSSSGTSRCASTMSAPENQPGAQSATMSIEDSAGVADSEVLGHRWLLLRHGQTDFNAAGRVQGSSDSSRLSPEGVEQARAVGRFLAKLPIDRVYVSPLTRAQETLERAEEVAGRTFADSKAVINDLREVDLHEWEGLYKQKIKEKWPGIYEQWRGDSPGDFRLESGAYPIRDLWARASRVWEQLLQEAGAEEGAESLALLGTKSTLVTGHNGINQALLARALGLSEEAFRKFEFPNCGVVELVWNPGEDKARMWRWLYPERGAWKSVAETCSEWSSVTDTDAETECGSQSSGRSCSPITSPCTD